MNKTLKTILAMLLLCLFGATEVLAQESRQSDYSNNLQFLNTNGYVGTGNQTYYVGSTMYKNGIKSFRGNGYRFPTVAFKVPVGTKYLHFHIFGDVANANFTMKVGDAAILENKILPYDATIAGTSPLTFGKGSGSLTYQRIELREPLEANSIVEITSSAAEASFLVFGVYYEDNLRPHKGTTAGNPFTASEAKSLADDYIKLTDKVYVRGFVSKQATTEDPATFCISDDASHTNEIQVYRTNDLNDALITDKNKVLPRDKVTIYAEIATPTGRNLINGKVWSQTHPMYEVVRTSGTSVTTMPMQDNYGDANSNKWPLHTFRVGNITASDHFYIREKYNSSDEGINFYGPTSEGYYAISEENMTDIPLTAGEGGEMCVTKEGQYTLIVKQVTDGPTLTLDGPSEPMYSIITNGDLEGEDASSFFKREAGGDIVPATFTEGAGVNGTRGIVIRSRDNNANHYMRWDTELFIRANQTLPAGTKYHLAFDYKADREAPSESRCYDENFREIYEHGLGTMGFTTKWQHFESEGEITADHSPNDAMRTVGFFLAVLSDAATYYFDNIVFEIDKPKGLLGDVNGDGVINVTDVTELVAYILGNPSSSFILDNADVSGEGNVDVTDVTALVNIILKGNASE